MEKLALTLESFAITINTALHFFDGIGLLLVNLFCMFIVFVLFYFLVPGSYARLLRWSAFIGGVKYIAEWLATK
jgi:hypothetical protein